MKADFKQPKDIKIGDTIMGQPIIEIKGLVNGKPTYASSFIVKGEINGRILKTRISNDVHF